MHAHIAAALVFGAPPVVADGVSSAASGSTFVQIITILSTAGISGLGAYLAWSTDRRRTKREADREKNDNDEGREALLDTIRDLRNERDSLLKIVVHQTREEAKKDDAAKPRPAQDGDAPVDRDSDGDPA